ncbi:hypothetical protein BDA96_07G173200 [Sorghum bicolor]|uniref:Uncharacterized protein n=2 Tax=Sorghum bicolor TaxID=4558 RepID=A0A1Z5RA62_SORBI|nr:hypothetical protein BDA96_07G173200 [Sorghum bicolor]OQU80663.1 hypothetical protein SORBI_3007G161450 [Sorghum bicolor]OQU80664.1 hypothetical protein SORBI_3007G161450 [Sorghum bicolor]
MKTTSSRMPPPAALLSSSQNQKPGYSEMGDGEERTNIQPDHHPELEQADGRGRMHHHSGSECCCLVNLLNKMHSTFPGEKKRCGASSIWRECNVQHVTVISAGMKQASS